MSLSLAWDEGIVLASARERTESWTCWSPFLYRPHCLLSRAELGNGVGASKAVNFVLADSIDVVDAHGEERFPATSEGCHQEAVVLR